MILKIHALTNLTDNVMLRQVFTITKINSIHSSSIQHADHVIGIHSSSSSSVGCNIMQIPLEILSQQNADDIL